MRLRRYAPTMMLLMGMWISFTKNPMKPMMAKPMAVAIAIFWNSENKRNKMLIKSIVHEHYSVLLMEISSLLTEAVC
jgi:hypothetical protein